MVKAGIDEWIKRNGMECDYHEGDSGDGAPGVAEGGAGELELSEAAGVHDGDQRDGVVGHAGRHHRRRERQLPRRLLPVPPSPPPPPPPPLAVAAAAVLLLLQQRSSHCPLISTHLNSSLNSQLWFFCLNSFVVKGTDLIITVVNFACDWIDAVQWHVNDIYSVSHDTRQQDTSTL